jgi:adenosylcobinamide-GDP ribazoletransferase
MDFQGIARYAPLVGLGLGGLLAGIDALLGLLGMPMVPRSGVLVAVALGLTGGLHLDGAMDAGDGLAVMDPQRRLTVMADSRTGAFGVMVAVLILGLKTLALAEITVDRSFLLMAIAGWGRWGQVVAIARYPYLKAEGKGAFHKATAQPGLDWRLGLALLLAFSGSALALGRSPLMVTGTTLGGFALAILVGAWFHRRLGGHTGDTYGAVVEWTETLLLLLATILQP